LCQCQYPREIFKAAKKKTREKEENDKESGIKPHANEKHEPSRNGLALQLRRKVGERCAEKVMN
jgi:hypothetical protein